MSEDDIRLRRTSGAFEVLNKRCSECLFSDAKIVSDRRKASLLRKCDREGTHFVCHQAQLAGWDVACKGWQAERGYRSQLYRIAERLGVVKFVSLKSLLKRKKADSRS